jgi:hypothetical protein
VLCSFTISGGLALICCITQFLIDRDTRWIKNPETRARFVASLGGLILGLSDQQLVTGFSIIIAGFSQLNRGISTYHWETVANLVWLSTITHLATMTSLRKHLRANQLLKWLRVLSMGVLIVALMIVMAPLGFIFGANDVPNALPAWCLYHQELIPITKGNTRDYNGVYITFTFATLLYGYTIRVFSLYQEEVRESLPSELAKRLRFWPRKFMEKHLMKWKWDEVQAQSTFRRLFSRGVYKLLHSFYALTVFSGAVYGSTTGEVCNRSFLVYHYRSHLLSSHG